MNGSIFSELKSKFKYGEAYTRFIFINVAIFLPVAFAGLILFFLNYHDGIIQEPISKWFGVPSDLISLAQKPWTLFTYMFLHYDFTHILFNMLCLFWFGRIFTEYLTNKRFISTYILGGITGALFYVAAYNIFPVFSSAVTNSYCLGASAAVLAVLAAISTYLPNYSVHLMFFGPVKLKYVALVIMVIDLITIPKGNAGGHITHLGGAFYGFMYASQLKKGRNIAGWFDSTIKFVGNIFKPKPKMKVTYKNPGASTGRESYNDSKSKQQTIDDILDKISKSGYESLSKQEKELLFNMSKNL